MTCNDKNIQFITLKRLVRRIQSRQGKCCHWELLVAEEPDKLVLMETFVSDMHFSYDAVLLTTSKVIKRNLAKRVDSTRQILRKTRSHSIWKWNEWLQMLFFHFGSFCEVLHRILFKIDITSQIPLTLLAAQNLVNYKNSELIALSYLHKFLCKSIQHYFTSENKLLKFNFKIMNLLHSKSFIEGRALLLSSPNNYHRDYGILL